MTKQAGPWHHSGKKRRTIQVVCVACTRTSCITLYGFPNEYRDKLGLEKCIHCAVIGKLVTSDLGKTRIRPDTTLQMNFDWGQNGKK